MPVPFLDLRLQYESIKDEVHPAMQKVIESSSFALGPAVAVFEEEFAAFCGVKHCIGLSSGTAALTLLLHSYGIGPDDEVITVTNSFFATAESIVHVGAKPVLVDCEEKTALMDAQKIESAITAKTKAIVPVHLYGQCADMDAITAIAQKHKLLIIEDACQAHGALSTGKRAGSLGNGAVFSFYAGKNLGAYGEAGAVVTNDATIAQTIRQLREHGQSTKYHHDMLGWNERMDGIQGAVLSVKLKYLDAWNAKRREHAEQYQEMLNGIGDVRFIRHAELARRAPFGVEARRGASTHVYHLFVIRTAQRDGLQAHLREKGIDTGIHYPIPIHLLKAMRGYGWGKGDFPIAEKLANEILSLPMYPELREEQIAEVCKTIRSF